MDSRDVFNRQRRRKYHDDTRWHHLDAFATLNGTLIGNHDPENGSSLEILWTMLDIPVLLVVLIFQLFINTFLPNFFKVAIGLSTACLSILITYGITLGNRLRFSMVGTMDDLLAWVVYILWCLGMILLSCFLTTFVCPEAAGGGVPEIKTILSGTVKPVLLSIKLVFVKAFGLLLAVIGGLSVGKEGPIVHMSSAIADIIMRLPIFVHIHHNDSKRLEILACACASGVSSTFGTAFGGVLFSIELTCTTYMVHNLPKSFLTAICSMLLYVALGVVDQISLIKNASSIEAVVAQSHSGDHFGKTELLLFAGFGALCGILSVIFIGFVELIVRERNRFLKTGVLSREVLANRRFLLVSVISLVIVPLTYAEISLVSIDQQHTLIDRIFYPEDLGGISTKLLLYLPYKFFLTILSVTLPLPVGLFTPIFYIGGLLGRVYGEWVIVHFNITRYEPYQFALIGAAAFSTGVTRAISSAVILYELSGHPELRLPISVSYFTGNRFIKGIYEVLIDSAGTPFLPQLTSSQRSIPVSCVMKPLTDLEVGFHLSVLSFESTYGDAKLLLHRLHPNIPPVLPIVQSRLSMVIVGAVQTEYVQDVLYKLDHMFEIAKTPPVVLGISEDRYVYCDMNGRGTDGTGESESSSTAASSRPEAAPGTPSQPVHVRQAISDSSLHQNGKAWRASPEKAEMAERRTDRRHSLSLPMHIDIPHVTEMRMNAYDQTIRFILFQNGGRTAVPVVPSRSPSDAQYHYAVDPMQLFAIQLSIPIDPSPYQIVDSMILHKVEMVFRLLKLNQAFVTRAGKLVGVVSRNSLIEYIGNNTEKRLDKFKRLWRSFSRQRRSGYVELDSPFEARSHHSRNNRPKQEPSEALPCLSAIQL